ncbi:antibiotic biosynthesis monooxygenase [Roseiarcus sp.]|jgi:antibiotic biosynthesis monooxygenase (ABM) superfamily enzyme|uniref:antibiotic biosynthesis monooxygenase n=1 Tax=Roseiarcus sp. TaxID=1969460 RepID=UPI003F9E14CC
MAADEKVSVKPPPVVRVAVRRAQPNCGAAYEALLRGMFGDMKAFPGFVSADVVPPADEAGEYQVVTKFRTDADLRRWDESGAHADWLRRLDTVAEGAPAYRVITGLEAWFSPEVVPASVNPPRWRMTLATWLGIFPTASLLIWFVGPVLGFLPFLLRTAVLTGLIAFTMSYVVMPRLSRWLKAWLTHK